MVRGARQQHPPCEILPTVKPRHFCPRDGLLGSLQDPDDAAKLCVKRTNIFRHRDQGMTLGCLWVKRGEVADGQPEQAFVVKAACSTPSPRGWITATSCSHPIVVRMCVCRHFVLSASPPYIGEHRWPWPRAREVIERPQHHVACRRLRGPRLSWKPLRLKAEEDKLLRCSPRIFPQYCAG